ncbi:hypothetical protein EV426DRAFT_287924 [Tirmania nivea]|nr:hypothetical protein EV426DRAFT_287924 [Tirmania nivea]
MRRVVVTGLGAVTPFILASDCELINILNRDKRYAQLPCQIAAAVPRGKKVDGVGTRVSGWRWGRLTLVSMATDLRIALDWGVGLGCERDECDGGMGVG